jgi:hypothetical protein
LGQLFGECFAEFEVGGGYLSSLLKHSFGIFETIPCVVEVHFDIGKFPFGSLVEIIYD